MTPRKLRTAIRSYCREYHTGINEIKQGSLLEFIRDYSEAVEDLEKERKYQEQQRKLRERNRR